MCLLITILTLLIRTEGAQPATTSRIEIKRRFSPEYLLSSSFSKILTSALWLWLVHRSRRCHHVSAAVHARGAPRRPRPGLRGLVARGLGARSFLVRSAEREPLGIIEPRGRGVSAPARLADSRPRFLFRDPSPDPAAPCHAPRRPLSSRGARRQAMEEGGTLRPAGGARGAAASAAAAAYHCFFSASSLPSMHWSVPAVG